MIICDECHTELHFDFHVQGAHLCKECYEKSEHYPKNQLEEDYGVKIGRQLAKFDSFCHLFYDSDIDGIISNLNTAIQQFGIKASPVDSDGDAWVIGFTQEERK